MVPFWMGNRGQGMGVEEQLRIQNKFTSHPGVIAYSSAGIWMGLVIVPASCGLLELPQGTLKNTEIRCLILYAWFHKN